VDRRQGRGWDSDVPRSDRIDSPSGRKSRPCFGASFRALSFFCHRCCSSDLTLGNIVYQPLTCLRSTFRPQPLAHCKEDENGTPVPSSSSFPFNACGSRGSRSTHQLLARGCVQPHVLKSEMSISLGLEPLFSHQGFRATVNKTCPSQLPGLSLSSARSGLGLSRHPASHAPYIRSMQGPRRPIFARVRGAILFCPRGLPGRWLCCWRPTLL
jgi:hypothetical protein